MYVACIEKKLIFVIRAEERLSDDKWTYFIKTLLKNSKHENNVFKPGSDKK